MWEEDGRWRGHLDGSTKAFSTSSRQTCLAALRRAAGPQVSLAIEIMPELAGVAEAADILGWDKRRVITYVSRGSFPKPVASLASGRVWRRDDVEAYARSWKARHERRLKKVVP